MSGVTTATVIAGASLAMTAVGTVMSTVGGMEQSAAQGRQAEEQQRLQYDASQRQARDQAEEYQRQQQAAQYQAQVARNAKQVAEWQAADAEKRGAVAEEQRRTKTRLQIGAQRAAMASMGADIGEGSSVDIIGDTAAVGEQDALTIRNNSSRDAWERKQVATNYESDAQMNDWVAAGQGRQSALATDRANAPYVPKAYESDSWLGVGSNLIAGASSVADKWSIYKTKGIF